MRTRLFISFLSTFLFAGCASSPVERQERGYRDPVSYSFEAYTPHTEESSFLQFFSGIRETSRQIKEWEKKHLW